MKQQIRLTETSIRNIINEVLSDYRNGKLPEDIDNPSFVPFNMDAHVDNPSKEQVDADNEWSRQHAFSPYRNKGDYGNSLEGEELPEVPEPFDSFDFNNSPEEHVGDYEDENGNVWDTNGVYSMMSLSDDPYSSYIGKTKMPTRRTTWNKINASENGENNDEDSVLDKIVSENIDKILRKYNKNKR